jgi:protein FAM50
LTPTTGLAEPPPKKKKSKAKKLLSFDNEDEDHGDTSAAATRKSQEPKLEEHALSQSKESTQRKLVPNPNTSIPAPKVMTKASLQAEAITREKLRKEFLAIQEAVKATEIAIPFVFYDGTATPGGTVKVKKGDHVWLFLERCRKVGAELGVSGGATGIGSGLSSNKTDNRKAWARVGVDDLMCVRGNIIVPHVSLSPSPYAAARLTRLSTTNSTTLLRTRFKIHHVPVVFYLIMLIQQRRRRTEKSLCCFVVQEKRDLRVKIMIQR